VENPARPLGVGRPVERVTVSVPLVDGEVWVLLSDGVVEAMSPDGAEDFGFDRLEAALAACGGKSAREVLERSSRRGGRTRAATTPWTTGPSSS
jgi:Serine phosphatase RsbU, regulator of sigma subunit